MERITHRVTCKIALYNPNKSKVLIAEYGPGSFGLIGGHLEQNEKPEDAVLREIKEEIGIDYRGKLEKADFFMHHNGKIILGFVGELSESEDINMEEREFSRVFWANIDDIRSGKQPVESYEEFILNNA
jgi:8-oxo-dGTP pyrophosphatase MutT (NUDIX family)